MEIEIIIESDGSVLPGQCLQEWQTVLETGYDEHDLERIDTECIGG
jgi:hypothetical protein